MHGRDEDLHRIEQLMHATATQLRGQVAVLMSGAGTGKTRLLLEAMSCAARRGFMVVDGVPKSLALVYSRQERHDLDRVNSLVGQVEAQLDDHLRRGPVFMAFDDAQWTDPAVLRALCALATKLESSPVLWLVVARSEHAESVNGLALRSLVQAVHGSFLGPLPPLSGDAVVEVVADLLAAAPDDDLVAVCQSVGDTPRAIVDLVRHMREQGCLSVIDGVARLVSGPLSSGIASAVATEPAAQLPRPFLHAMRARLNELSARAQDVLQVAAVLGYSFDPHDLAELLDERPTQLLAPLQEALAAGLLRSSSDVFVFRREPVWRAVLDTVPEPLRCMLHRQAATILLGRADDQTETAAVHLVHCAEIGDADALTTIQDAAHRMLRASPQSAAALATRGIRLTEPGSPDHIALATTATAALVRLGELTRAIDLAHELLHNHTNTSTNTDSDATRPLRIWLDRALMLRGDFTATRYLRTDGHPTPTDGHPAAAFTTSSHDPHSECLLLDMLSHNHQATVITLADRVLTDADAHSRDVQAAALNVRAMANWREGKIDDAFSTVEEAVLLRGAHTETWQCDPLWTKAWMLTRVRKLDDALAITEATRRTIDSERNNVLTPIPLALRATILLAKGDIAGAEADAAAGLIASEQAEMPLYEPQLHAVRVIAALRRGELAAAADGLRQLEQSSPAERVHRWTMVHRTLTAVVTEARRGAQEAMTQFRDIPTDQSLRIQLVLEDPLVTSWTVRTALAANERVIAELVVSTAEQIAATNPGYDTLTAAAQHGRALFDNDAAALAGLAEMYGDPWAAASTVEDLGSLLCNTDREQAVRELSHAMTAYDQLGAEWDSARIRRKLRQLGVRRRHWNHETRPEAGWDSLTGTEEKVARLVAGGLTNRQVANELFISPHTVGFHLRQIYRKLSIQSRVDLARIAP